MRKSAVRAAFAATFFVAASVLLSSIGRKEAGMITQIRLTQPNGRTVVVALDDNKTTLDLLAKLPLTLSFEDYNRTEKVTRPFEGQVVLERAAQTQGGTTP